VDGDSVTGSGCVACGGARAGTEGAVSDVRAWRRSRREPIAATMLLLALGVVAGATGFALQPAVSGDVGPGTVTVDPGFRGGDTVVALPPLGELRADTHDGPLAFAARVDRIDLDQAQAVARDDDPAGMLRSQIQSDLGPLLRGLALQSVVVAVLAGLVAGLVLPQRRIRSVATVVVGALAFVAVGGAMAATSFEPASFDQPEFEGALAKAPDVINTVQRHIEDVDEVESRLQALSHRVAGLYRTVDGDTARAPADVVLLHVSDIHSNPVGIELVEETADQFQVDAIVDTGDITSFGADIEKAVADRIARIELPYYLVPGNHDHPTIRDSLAAAGVTVLDPGVVEVEGIRMLGVGEPTFTADNRVSAAMHDRALERSAEELRDLVRRHHPDVVAVHNRRQLELAHGEFDIGLAGHVHEPTLRYLDGTAVIEAGSAGATGVEALMSQEDLPYQMQLLHFVDGKLTAIDRLSFEGTDGEFRLGRLLIDPSQVAGYPETESGIGPLYRRIPS
jgi:predicted phosphodiesterase